MGNADQGVSLTTWLSWIFLPVTAKLNGWRAAAAALQDRTCR